MPLRVRGGTGVLSGRVASSNAAASASDVWSLISPLAALCSAHPPLLQDAFSKAVGTSHVGRDVGEGIFPKLVAAWRAMKIEGEQGVVADAPVVCRGRNLCQRMAAKEYVGAPFPRCCHRHPAPDLR
jgi:hypothetical protein